MEINKGWIKLHRSMLDNPVVCKDPEHMAVWVYLLLEATHQNISKVFKGDRITLQPGQLITGRKVISEKLHINESKVQRILKNFKNEHQIEQQSSSRGSLITILAWNDYQNTEQQVEQKVNSKRTESEQQLNTLQECKNDNNERSYYSLEKRRKSISELSKIALIEAEREFS